MVGTPYIIVVAATFAVFANSASDFCKLESCQGPYHTICKFGLLKVNRNQCGKLKSAALTPTEIRDILNIHNSYRKLIASGQEKRGNPYPQPAATNLRDLTWDAELANFAQSWADQCHLGHDQCRHSERFKVGQNVGYKSSDQGYIHKFTEIVTMWYDEVDSFNSAQVESVTDFNEVTHYCQMMWAETKYLGCGGVRFQDGEWYRTFLVCNYGPKGNWYGEKMYQPR